MRPEDIAAVMLLLGIAAIVAFVIIRERRKQGTSRIPLRKIAQNVRQEVDDFVDGVVSFAGSVLWFVIIVAVVFGGLWLVIAVVKWMWQHS
jgi:hypothetical protein